MRRKQSGLKDRLCVIYDQAFELVARHFEEQVGNYGSDFANEDDIIDDRFGDKSVIFRHDRI